MKGVAIRESGEEVKLGDITCNILSVSRENQARCFQLAKRFAVDSEVELKAEDIVFIKSVLEKSGMPALTVGQIIEELEKTV